MFEGKNRGARVTALVAAGGIAAVTAVAQPASAAATMTVTLHSITCLTTEDWLGADEPYLLVNGRRVWGDSSMNDVESSRVDVTVTSTGTAWVHLYDEDAGWFDDDDLLGVLLIGEDQIGAGVQQGRFTLDGADYTLYYEVS